MRIELEEPDSKSPQKWMRVVMVEGLNPLFFSHFSYFVSQKLCPFLLLEQKTPSILSPWKG